MLVYKLVLEEELKISQVPPPPKSSLDLSYLSFGLVWFLESGSHVA